MTYTKEDIGCYIDGAFGMDHAMVKLAILLIDFMPLSVNNTRQFPSEELAETYEILLSGDESKLSDDYSELNDATDILQEHTEDGLVWIWDAGDLILTADEVLRREQKAND